MTVERALRLMAGFFVLVSLALGYFVSPYWLLFTAFVGLNLFQSGLTNWCPAMFILRKLGLPGGGVRERRLTIVPKSKQRKGTGLRLLWSRWQLCLPIATSFSAAGHLDSHP